MCILNALYAILKIHTDATAASGMTLLFKYSSDEKEVTRITIVVAIASTYAEQVMMGIVNTISTVCGLRTGAAITHFVTRSVV